jgi:hypothetical protein
MTGTRKLEISLAALIAGAGMFAAFAPGASSTDRGVYRPPALNAPAPTFRASDFADLELSTASRAVAAQVMSGETQATRFTRSAPEGERLRAPAGLRIAPRASATSGAAWAGQAVGLEVTAAPLDGKKQRWWLVGGAGRESYAVAPAGLREFTVAPVGAETTIGDAHLGVAFAINDRAYASVGYVRENRKFVLGAEDWEEDEHYIGVGLQARW